MKIAKQIAGGLLGLVFIVFGLNFFFRFIPIPPAPEGSPAAQFMGALFASGFLTFVKVLEIMGGVLTAIPKTRAVGLLILVPIVVNILAYHIFLGSPAGLFQPPVLLITGLSAFLAWSHRDGLKKLGQT